jgi:arsenite-transporting ATPase
MPAPTRRRRTCRYRLVGGKGGVGKTTCAAAIGIDAAASGVRTLVLSTDPAPSLGDALKLRLSGRPRRVPLRRGQLFAAEVDAAAAIRQWLAPRTPTLRATALRGTWLDESDVDRLFSLSLPGIDELAGLLEIARFGRSGRYDLVVVDTAPTGHTLRMLATPDMLAGVAAAFDAMQDKHRAIVGALRGRWTPDAADRLIESLASEAESLARLIRDPEQAQVAWVTLAERVAVEEAIDALEALAAAGIPVDTVVINRLTPAGRRACRFCAARRQLEQAAQATLIARFPASIASTAEQVGIAERVTEPVGVTALAAMAHELSVPYKRPRASRRVLKEVMPAYRKAARHNPSIDFGAAAIMLFGGKGGVGKTTCAAAAALQLAAAQPSRKVLLLSADPAHSLSDVLQVPVGDDVCTIAGGPLNLRAREVDAARTWRRIRDEYSAAIDRLFGPRGGTLELAHDRRVMQGLLDLAPPGLDELVAITEVTSLVAERTASAGWDMVVIDTAPTGHALRLLEMPSLIHEWTHALMRIVLKYQPVTGAGQLGERLLSLSRQIGRLRALLRDKGRTQFVVVGRAATLPRLETTRMVKAVSRLSVAVPLVVVNAVGRGTCDACRRAHRAERLETSRLVRDLQASGYSGCLMIAPAVLPPPSGVAALERWASTWQRTA